MKTQYDSKVRVVALENLRAMCERASGVCHCYSVIKVSRSRVHVEYSNPNEYGHDRPMTAVFPCYPNHFDREGSENPMVVLEYMRVIGDNWGGEGWQAFEIVRDMPQLWRDPASGKWRTEDELNFPPDAKVGDCDLKALRAMQERGGQWTAYRNMDLGSANVGVVQFLQVGPGCTFDSPPVQYPTDGATGPGWTFRFAGWVDLETGEIRSDATVPNQPAEGAV